jgi:hypothetical protein
MRVRIAQSSDCAGAVHTNLEGGTGDGQPSRWSRGSPNDSQRVWRGRLSTVERQARRHEP